MKRDLSTVQKRIDFITGIINFDSQDLTTVTNVFNTLENVTDPSEWASDVDNLIRQVASFNLSTNDKATFTASLQILRSSYGLWSEGSYR